MSTIEKLKQRFSQRPVPNDITFDETARLAAHYGCQIISGGKHSKKIVDKISGTVIPIPMHGKFIREAYIQQLNELFSEIESRKD